MNKLDCAMFVFWALLSLRNIAALLPLFSLCVFAVAFSLFNVNFPIFCITAITYIQLAQTNITISSELRYAFLAIACVYLAGAVDSLLYNQIHNYGDSYFDVMPKIIILLNAYIAAVIFKDGGRNNVGFITRLRALAVNCLHRLHGI